ncbi:MAG TPA: hypothetical protein VNG71_17535 [Pyrinomonadaceae bacterium]|nr:hypothetical protein [Pyrinomonadaceae bacterium]
MSVLSFPRIYFKGFMEWDPCTFNNNDWAAFPTYDATNAALNWPFLSTQGTQVPPGITPANFITTFRPWAISLLDDTNPNDNPPNGPAGNRVPAEWNMFGTHGVSFVQYEDYTTTIIGGDLGYDQPVTSDTIIGQPVTLSGDGGSGPGRLVDTNPVSPWSSQIYFGQFALGGGSSGLSGPRVYRMHSRWLNPNRIYSTDQILTSPASSIGVCFQTCIPYDQVNWNDPNSSQLISSLQGAAQQPGALGIMIRFTGYVNIYFVNGLLNNIQAQPRDYPSLAQALAAAWDPWYQSGDTSQFFSNPCYSHIVGVVGVWNEGELASVPGGRCLAADVNVSPLGLSGVKSKAAPPPAAVVVMGHELKSTVVASVGDPVPLGPVAVNVDYDASLISLDLNSTMPELGTPGSWPSDLTKADFGQLTVGVMNAQDFTPIATVDYDQYQRSAYEARAGIIDIPFPNSGTGELLQHGTIAIQAQGQTALLEQTYTAETDTRGIYLDQNGHAEFQVMVCQMGSPSPGANVLLAQYDSGLNLVPSSGTQYVLFQNGNVMTINAGGIETVVTTLPTDQNGNATFVIGAVNPGFPVIGFFPYAVGGALPQPTSPFSFVDDAFYTTVRVLPFDDAVPQAFVDLWNGNQDPAAAWTFVYGEILYVYDMLFNVMLKYVNLGSQQSVEQNLNGIWSAITQEAAVESTYAMPVTRDMSSGKRLALQLWIYLVANNYDVPNFNVNSIPPDWSPPS